MEANVGDEVDLRREHDPDKIYRGRVVHKGKIYYSVELDNGLKIAVRAKQFVAVYPRK